MTVVIQDFHLPVPILRVPCDKVTLRETLEIVDDRIAPRHLHSAATANVDFVVRAIEDVERSVMRLTKVEEYLLDQPK